MTGRSDPNLNGSKSTASYSSIACRADAGPPAEPSARDLWCRQFQSRASGNPRPTTTRLPFNSDSQLIPAQLGV